ncbi:MAG: fibronectin type III domain-containing protein [Candidatus Eisenbacteria bacterium]
MRDSCWPKKRISGVTPVGMLAACALLMIVACSEDNKPQSPIQDEIPPASVTDLALSVVGDSAIVLRWTAPGDDGANGTAASYDLRHAVAMISSTSWENAVMLDGVPVPQAAGGHEEYAVPDLRPDSSRFFALCAVDEAGNRAELSNVAALDRDPPATIGDLHAEAVTPYAITLQWTAPADNGPSGMADSYDLRYGEAPLTGSAWDSALVAVAPAPLSAGTSQNAKISGLHPATRYYFALRSEDDSANESELSNVLEQETNPEGTWWDGFAGQGPGDRILALSGSYSAGLVAGGTFTSAGGQDASRIALWNGAAWEPLGFGFSALFGTAAVQAIDVFESGVIAAGYFSHSGATAVNNIARWDGAMWSPLRGGTDGYVLDLAVHDGDLIVAGGFFTVDGMDIYSIARWDGAAWRSMGWNTTGFGAIAALEVYDGALIAGGSFTQAGSAAANNVARWNGHAWSPLGEGLTGGVPSSMVSALAVYEGELIAAGAFGLSGTTEVANIARWDGSDWLPLGAGVGDPGSGERVLELAVLNDRLIVGGDFSIAGGIPAFNIVAWDGVGWSSLSSGLDGQVSTLAVRDGHLFVGGDFQNAGGSSSPYIARWDE